MDFSAPPQQQTVREVYEPESVREEYAPAYSPQPAYEPEAVQEEVQMEYAPPPTPQERPVAPPARGATARSSMQSLDDLLKELQK